MCPAESNTELIHKVRHSRAGRAQSQSILDPRSDAIKCVKV